MAIALRRQQFPDTDEAAIVRILFREDSLQFESGWESLLELVAGELESHPEFTMIEVRGFADRGEHDPLGLSLRRAQTVVDWLVRRGIEWQRLVARAIGADKPVQNGYQGEQNRRVEFRVTHLSGKPVRK